MENGLDEIDASIQEVERILGESRNTYIQDTEQPLSAATSSMKALLTVEHKYVFFPWYYCKKVVN